MGWNGVEEGWVGGAYLPMKAIRHTSREVESRAGPDMSGMMFGMTKVLGGRLHPLPVKKLTMCWVGLITTSASCRLNRSCDKTTPHKPFAGFHLNYLFKYAYTYIYKTM